MIYVRIQGHDIFETLRMPEVPRKGDLLWLESLTRGGCKVTEVIVSKVEWSRDQSAINYENEGIGVWLTVRRTTRPHPKGIER